MAKTIGQLTQATTIGGSDEFVIEQTGITKRVAASVVRGGLVNADVASNAAIAFSKLAALDSANILVGNGSNVATKVAVSGDATLSNAGAVTLAAASITGKTQLTDPLASGDEFLVHDTSASALRRVAWSALQPAGSVLQTVQATNTALQVCSTTIPWDDTIPQSGEGDEIFTASITPSSASNKILVRVTAYGAASAGWYTIAVFKDSDANAIAAAWGIGQNVDYQGTTSIEYLHSPATTSAVTYKVRAGSSSGSYRLNGAINSAGRLFGGVSFSGITLQEIKG